MARNSDTGVARRSAGGAKANELLRDKERSKAVLLATATELFACEGFEGVTMDTIAEHAGLNKRLIYYYYQDKNQLYEATIKAAYMQFEVALLVHRSPKSVRSWVIDALKFLGEQPNIAKLLNHDLLRRDVKAKVQSSALHKQIEKLASESETVAAARSRMRWCAPTPTTHNPMPKFNCIGCPALMRATPNAMY